mmetsp:Transcript_1127/g.1720  ORF Transcript_1127/g.1720 Transcript_1127/m.1720 type:complete len:190 (+) Transcript_1127:504-1073(+)
MVNLVMTVVEEEDRLRTICLSRCIIAKDSTAEEQAKSIIGQFHELARLLKEWWEMTMQMFPERLDLLDKIPSSGGICVSHMNGVHVSMDTCNVAQAVQVALGEHILDIWKSLGLPKDEFEMFSACCYQHMHNILANGVKIPMDAELTQLLKPYLDLFPRHLRIQCSLTNLVRMVDKEIMLVTSVTATLR